VRSRKVSTLATSGRRFGESASALRERNSRDLAAVQPEPAREDVRLTEQLAWWRRGVVYEIYPRSFMDASGDGVGDLQGIVDRLDYLSWLGVDALWLTPVFPSPMVDFGYDVSDYTDIDPVFGDLATMDMLISEAHAREIRIVLDLYRFRHDRTGVRFGRASPSL
jgi:1,4-alpha-glucan branching enzyme